MKLLNVLFLAIWLIAIGVIALLDVRFDHMYTVLAVLQIAAGIFLVLGMKKFKAFHHLAAVLLAIFLIVSGAIALFGISLPAQGLLLGVLSIAVAVFMFLGFKNKKWMDNAIPLLLAIYFVVHGLTMLIDLNFDYKGIIMAIIALAAGILLLVPRR